MTDRVTLDHLDVRLAAMEGVRRGGTVPISGVYGGEVEPVAEDDLDQPIAAETPEGCGGRGGTRSSGAW